MGHDCAISRNSLCALVPLFQWGHHYFHGTLQLKTAATGWLIYMYADVLVDGQ